MTGVGIVLGIKTIIPATTCRLDKRLRRLGILKQILLNIGTDLIKIGRIKETKIHIIHMLGHLHYADALITYTGQYA